MQEYRDYWKQDEPKGFWLKPGSGGGRLGGGITPAVKALLISIVAMFVVQLVCARGLAQPRPLEPWLALWPVQVFEHLWLWQLVTPMFLHDIGSIWHVLFNGWMLFMFGPLVERHYGTKRFLWLYLIAGLLGNIAFAVVGYLSQLPTFAVGASGAISGVVVACALLYPSLQVLLFGIVPMRMATMAVLVIALDVWQVLASPQGVTGSLAHLGGALVGLMFVRGGPRVFAWFEKVEREMKAKERQKQRAETRATRAQVDELLDKISREGITSLSEDEKAFLKSASSKYGQGR